MSQKSVLFVCLGNICRSPMAEVALRAAAVEAGLALTIGSAGTGGWHAGDPADSRAVAEAARHGVDLTRHRARQVGEEDFSRFGQIFALDQQNLRDLKALAPRRATARLDLLMDWVPERVGTAVVDPYYGGPEDFAQAWDDVARAARCIVARLT